MATPKATNQQVPLAWQARADQADPSFPILVIRDSHGLWVADGNHRLWQAFKKKQRYIMAHIITLEEAICLNSDV